MTTLDAIILLLIFEVLATVAWVQFCKAQHYGRLRTKRPPKDLEAPKDPPAPEGPVL